MKQDGSKENNNKILWQFSLDHQKFFFYLRNEGRMLTVFCCAEQCRALKLKRRKKRSILWKCQNSSEFWTNHLKTLWYFSHIRCKFWHEVFKEREHFLTFFQKDLTDLNVSLCKLECNLKFNITSSVHVNWLNILLETSPFFFTIRLVKFPFSVLDFWNS